MGRVGGIGQDASRTDREHRSGLHRHRGGGTAPGTVDEGQPAIGAEEEPDPDVAAGCPPSWPSTGRNVAVVVDRTPGRGNRRDQLGGGGIRGHDPVVGRAAVVLHLLQHHQIRSRQGIDDDLGQTGELLRRIARVEVLHVEGGDGQLIGQPAGLAASRCSHPARRHRRRGQDLVAPEAVVDHPYHRLPGCGR